MEAELGGVEMIVTRTWRMEAKIKKKEAVIILRKLTRNPKPVRQMTEHQLNQIPMLHLQMEILPKQAPKSHHLVVLAQRRTSILST
jgi:hypothetical protein